MQNLFQKNILKLFILLGFLSQSCATVAYGNTCVELFRKKIESKSDSRTDSRITEKEASTLKSEEITDFLIQDLQRPAKLAAVGENPLVPENRPAVEMILRLSLERGYKQIAEIARQTIANGFRQSEIFALVTEFVFSDLVETPKDGQQTWNVWGKTREDFNISLPSDTNLQGMNYRKSDDKYWTPYVPKVLFYTANRGGFFKPRQTFLARSSSLVLVGLPIKMTNVHENYATPWESIFIHDWGFHAARRFLGDLFLLSSHIHLKGIQNVSNKKFQQIKDFIVLVQFDILNKSATPAIREIYRQKLEQLLNRERKITLSLDKDIQLLAMHSPKMAESAYEILHHFIFEANLDIVAKRLGLPVSMALDLIEDSLAADYLKVVLKISTSAEKEEAKDWLVKWWSENKNRTDFQLE